MLENVEHEDELKSVPRLILTVERPNEDALAATRQVAPNPFAGLAALDIPDLRQPREKQSVAAAHVEYAAPAAGRLQAADRVHDHVLSRAPPPMPFVQVAIPAAVLRIHLRLLR